jgi:hypothetical protein
LCFLVRESRITTFTVLPAELNVSSHHSVAAWLEYVEQSISDARLYQLRAVVLRVLGGGWTRLDVLAAVAMFS